MLALKLGEIVSRAEPRSELNDRAGRANGSAARCRNKEIKRWRHA